MQQATHGTGTVLGVLAGVLIAAALAVGATLLLGHRLGAISRALVAPAVLAVAVLASVGCAAVWSRGRHRRREEARTIAPPLTWAHPDVDDAVMSDPSRKERIC